MGHGAMQSSGRLCLQRAGMHRHPTHAHTAQKACIFHWRVGPPVGNHTLTHYRRVLYSTAGLVWWRGVPAQRLPCTSEFRQMVRTGGADAVGLSVRSAELWVICRQESPRAEVHVLRWRQLGKREQDRLYQMSIGALHA